MSTSLFTQVLVADDVLLDSRLGLFHRRKRWLAVADLHFGYEVSHRARGNLFPLWGMQNIETRLKELLEHYHPLHLVLLGDLIHDRAAIGDFYSLAARLRAISEVILIAGNHDRSIRTQTLKFDYSDFSLVESWRSDGFYFHHGDCEVEEPDSIQIIGHHHPAGAVRDGAGLRLKLPAFVQRPGCWIMPAFSPWAGGTEWSRQDENCRMWLCSPRGILPLDASAK